MKRWQYKPITKLLTTKTSLDIQTVRTNFKRSGRVKLPWNAEQNTKLIRNNKRCRATWIA